MISCKQARPLAAAAFFAFFAFFAAAVLDANITTAAAGSLFDPATAAEMSAAPPSGGTMRDGLRGPSDGSLRNRLVTLNATELARIVPVGLDNARNRLEQARTLSRAVTLDLFPGVSVTAERKDIEAPDEGGYIWAGEVDGDDPSFVTLVINNNSVLGQIQKGGRLYSIEPVSGRLHRIIEIDESRILKDMHPPLPAEAIQHKSGAAESPAKAADSQSVTNIRVLVANTITARSECVAGGTVAQDQQCMQARINLAISLANQAFARSGVLIKFVRVGEQVEVSYDDVNSYGKNSSNNYIGLLCDLSNFLCGYNNQTNKFAPVRTRREQFDADLVVLMRKAGAGCGVAFAPNPPTASTSNTGFSVVTSTKGGFYNCIEGNTFAHETGHNMGLFHDRYVEAAASNAKFNYGYVDSAPAGRFREIMSYPDKCAAAGVSCARIPYMSTPLKLYNGRKIGIPQSQVGAADGARTLNTTRAIVGAYR
jgi:Metallo-peptidase family M12B Reprolysin-like